MKIQTPFSWRRILSLVQVRPVIGGLEISDTSLRYACYDGVNWYLTVLRLPPGLIQNGKVQDPLQFRRALSQMRSQITAIQGRRKHIDVAVSLSSVSVYSQIFSLPVIEGDNLEKAIQLNVQMASPKKGEESYAGWQMVGQDPNAVRLEILSAFIERGVVDGLVQALKDTGFEVHSVESRSSSLARVIRELGVGFNVEKSYLALSVDGSGMDFLVIRGGALYFQYFLSWHDVYGGEKEVPQERFSQEVVRSARRVLNFYNSHWSEPLAGFYIAATGLEQAIIKIVEQSFSLRILELQLNFPQKISPAWYVAVGTGLRGLTSPRDDREMSLLGVSAQKEFERSLTLRFVEFWRVLVPVAISILVMVFLAADIFLRRTLSGIENNNSYFKVGERQEKDIAALQARVTAFNESVGLVSNVIDSIQPHYEAMKTIRLILDEHDVRLVRLTLQSFDAPVQLSGEVSARENIANLAAELKKNPRFSDVHLPLREIRDISGGQAFTISFKISPKTN